MGWGPNNKAAYVKLQLVSNMDILKIFIIIYKLVQTKKQFGDVVKVFLLLSCNHYHGDIYN